MGTHPNGPAQVRLDTLMMPLSQYIARDRVNILGPLTASGFQSEGLPFLFKVLSVNKALSIQAHPHRELAAELHAQFPEIYKDPNHKPELAIALTPFEALCCFRPVAQIASSLANVPELRAVVGEQIAADFCQQFLTSSSSSSLSDQHKKIALRQIFTCLMKSQPDLVACQLRRLTARLQLEEKQQQQVLNDQSRLVIRLSEQFSDDVGCFCVYFLNYSVLQPGEALYMAPNEPHAYLSGDCVECMANSDNVVRAGLTPKLKHVDILCNMLTYEDDMLERLKFSGHSLLDHQFMRIYRLPDVKEFQVLSVQLPEKNVHTSWKLPAASVLLVLDGKCQFTAGDACRMSAQRGSVFFAHAETQMSVCSMSDDGPVRLFVASSNF